MGSQELFDGLASNHNPPHLSLRSARIEGVSHWHAASRITFLKGKFMVQTGIKRIPVKDFKSLVNEGTNRMSAPV
jgi:hypothetical protein